MAGSQKSVFLSYRRKVGNWMARTVYEYLKRHEYDVFMDVESLDSGEFPQVILHQINARPHFLVVLMPGSLERTVVAGDWLRQEIEQALKSKRNIVPLLAEEFSFEAEAQRIPGKTLPSKVGELQHHNGVTFPADYFDAAMKKLTDRFLTKQVKVSLTPAPAEEEPIVKRMLANASLAKASRGGDWLWSPTQALEAPKLGRSAFGSKWQWTPVMLASGYVLQKSFDETFANPIEIYDGEDTSYPPSPASLPALERPLKRAFAVPKLRALDWMSFGSMTEHFRVKAKGGFAFLDSPWSNVVTVAPEQTLTIEAPVLSRSLEGGWSWTPVKRAIGYVLQQSISASFDNPIELYDGSENAYNEAKPLLGLSRLGWPLTRYYRVKAKGPGLLSDSPWSNVVELAPSPKLALDAPVLTRQGTGWTWTKVMGAAGYVLQMSEDVSFAQTANVYEGTQTQFGTLLLLDSDLLGRRHTLSDKMPTLRPNLAKFVFQSLKHYRVKATGDLLFTDSPWSNVVSVPSQET